MIINRTKSTTLAEECPEVSRRKNNLYWNALSSEVVGIGGPVGLSSPHDRSVIALTTKEQPGLTDEIVPGIHVVTDLDSLALMNSKFTGPGTLGAVVLIVVQQVYFKLTDALSGTKAKKA